MDSFVRDFHAHFTRNPNVCVWLGVPERGGDLPDPSLEEGLEIVQEARELIGRLDGIPTGGLAFDDVLDLDLARLELESEIHRETHVFNDRTQRQQMPTAGVDVGDGLFFIFANDPRPDAQRLADMTSRVTQVPEYLERQLARLDTPVQRWVDIDAEETSELPVFFATIERWAEETAWPDRERLGAAIRAANTAITSYCERLRGLPTTRRIHIGEKEARRVVALAGIDLTLEELHGIAREFLARTAGTVESLRERLVARHGLPAGTTVEQLQARLDRTFAVEIKDGRLEDVLDRYQAERERIDAFIAERDLFPVFAEQDMKLIRTPSFMEASIPAGAMMSPAAFRDGVRTSLVYLTLTKERIGEHTELSIPGMMIHEGIPGHHLQLAWASRHPSVIRRHVSASDHAEGWTTMLEDYMLDVGYMDDLADEARFCGKRDIARIGARVAIDLFLMTGERGYLDVGIDCDVTPDDPFEAAGNLLRAVTGFSAPRAHAELNWYSKERGTPLTYLAGNTLVWKLKRDVEASTGHGLKKGLELDRAFHRVYLESGNMPVRFLRRVYREKGLLDG